MAVLLISWAIAQWSGRKTQGFSLRLFSGTLFFVSICSFLSLLAQPDATDQFRAGGLIGVFSAHFFQYFFGSSALLVSFVFCILAVLLATEFLVIPILIALYRRFEKQFAKFWRQNKSRLWSQPLSLSPLIAGFNKRSKPTIRMAQDPSKSVSNRIAKELGADEKNRVQPIIRNVIPKESPVKPPSPLQPRKISLPKGDYKLPMLEFLDNPQASQPQDNLKNEIEDQSRILEETLSDFSIEGKVVEVERGPVITRFELQPASGVKIQKIRF